MLVSSIFCNLCFVSVHLESKRARNCETSACLLCWSMCGFHLTPNYTRIFEQNLSVSSLPQRFRFVFFVDSQLHVLTVCRFVKLSTFAPFSCFCVHKTRPNIMMIHLRSTNFTASFPEPFILTNESIGLLAKNIVKPVERQSPPPNIKNHFHSIRLNVDSVYDSIFSHSVCLMLVIFFYVEDRVLIWCLFIF